MNILRPCFSFFAFALLIAPIALQPSPALGALISAADEPEGLGFKKPPATKAKPNDDSKKDDGKTGSLKDEGSKLFGKPQTPAEGVNPSDGPAGWSVVIAVYRGQDASQGAGLALAKVRSEGGLPEAFLLTRGESQIIALGDYPSADDERAQAALHRVQQTEVNGSLPFAQAFLSPPAGIARPGTLPQYNLAKVKAAYGKDALYTLQVGAYGRLDLDKPTEQDLAEARKAAEEAVVRLRQEGELAFYYHSTKLSMVTVGVFDINDFDPQTPGYKSARLRDAQKRHPQNLYNGQGIREKRKGQNELIQPSNLVALPKS